MLPTNINEVIEQLNDIVIQSKNRQDRSGYFPALYKRVTIEIKNKIIEGYFDDNARMEKLDVVFANRYLDAWTKNQNGGGCTKSWELAFMATKKWNPLVIQHLFLGMNAHISLDLGIAAASISTEETIKDIKPDFFKINEILSSLIDEVQNELARIWPLLKPLDWLAGRLDEKLSEFAMEIARDAAWQVALEYVVLDSDEQKQDYLKKRDGNVFRFGKKLYQPGVLLRIIATLFRFIETGTIISKIKKLNGE